MRVWLNSCKCEGSVEFPSRKSTKIHTKVTNSCFIIEQNYCKIIPILKNRARSISWSKTVKTHTTYINTILIRKYGCARTQTPAAIRSASYRRSPVGFVYYLTVTIPLVLVSRVVRIILYLSNWCRVPFCKPNF